MSTAVVGISIGLVLTGGVFAFYRWLTGEWWKP